VIDCGAIPPNLAESTLFGHERGAFTGATERRKGALAEADGGTVFLDELGELPIDLQPKLLRVLADQRIKRVGSDTYMPVNVRVLAATRRDLLVEINRGGFRDDLYFRIAEERLELPPLRERLDDLRPLVQRILADLGNESAFARMTAESFDRLQRHDWPGNVRELRSLVKMALAYDRGGPIDLGARLRASPEASSRTKACGPGVRAYAESLEQHDRAYFAALFESTSGNISEMARRGDLHRATVREALEKHGIKSVARRRS
jgi:DNA-binding NtrC family response regulator